VTRQTRLNGNLRCLKVPDFSDQDHIRILPQNCAQPNRKGHVDLGVDLRLTDAINVVFNWVFDRQDVE